MMPDDEFTFDSSDMPRRASRPGRGGGAVARHPRAVDGERREQMRQELAQVEHQVREVAGADLTASQRIEKLLAINSTIIMGLLKEALGDEPDLDRSTVLGRALTAVKDTVTIIKTKGEMESVDSFNPRSPKFGIVFGWFIELVHRVLSGHADETVVANFFNDLVSELSGWEDRIERQFKGVAGKALASMQSPFVDEVKEHIKDAGLRESYIQSLEERLARAEERIAGYVAREQALGLPGPA